MDGQVRKIKKQGYKVSKRYVPRARMLSDVKEGTTLLNRSAGKVMFFKMKKRRMNVLSSTRQCIELG